MEVWIGRDGERHGPYQESDVRAWLRSGQVSPQDLGWHEGLADWQPLSSLFPDAASQGASAPPVFAAPTAALPRTNAASLEDYAGFWKRMAAYILDAIVLWIPERIIQTLMGAAAAQDAFQRSITAASNDFQAMMLAWHQYAIAMMPVTLVTAVLTWLYFSLMESSPLQATLGKLALGIRVTDEHGARISFLRATGRFFAKYLSIMILFIGFLMVAWTRRKQGLHDMLAGTLVLNGRARDFKATGQPPRNDRPNGSFNA